MDFMNFEISLHNYYHKLNETSKCDWPKIDYNLLFAEVSKLKNNDHITGYIFAPAPDEFLSKDDKILNNYKWLQSISNKKYIDVIFGRYLARPVNDKVPMDINNRDTYYKVEKGTDINLALHALSKAHYNSYDTAFVYSVDSDYINVYRQLKNIGKIVIIVTVKGQHISRDILPAIDDYIFLEYDFLRQCSKPTKQIKIANC